MYLRRMARELARQPNGFYYCDLFWSEAYFTMGELRIARVSGRCTDELGHEVEYRQVRRFRDLTGASFLDPVTGQAISASRTPINR